ncbi:hypothetical protein [Novosphingobium sp.]|uniref:hypothetical protein n=1 Tax=Novosphingobium sp. TaxID=1874826 RepID=UPI0026276E8F|nr:hypothetical protein [Novosphingobium sp.]
MVRELGGAIIAAGVVGLASLAQACSVLPTAISAGMFDGAAVVEHFKEPHRGRNVSTALVSDIDAAFVVLGFAVGTLMSIQI